MSLRAEGSDCVDKGYAARGVVCFEHGWWVRTKRFMIPMLPLVDVIMCAGSEAFGWGARIISGRVAGGTR